MVLDEGHRIKGARTTLNRCCAALATRRRVLLTGYPLQTRLLEYHGMAEPAEPRPYPIGDSHILVSLPLCVYIAAAMVDFARPGHLGDARCFARDYAQPISAGQAADAAPGCIARARRRVFHLQTRLAAFVLRRTAAEVLTRALPRRSEVAVWCALSPLQAKV